MVWAGQPNISVVVARAAERCGLIGPPRTPRTPHATLLPAEAEEDELEEAPQQRRQQQGQPQRQQASFEGAAVATEEMALD